MFTPPVANVADITGSWEKFSKFVEWNGHDAISREKGFFYTVSVMDINVNIKNTIVISVNMMKSKEKQKQKRISNHT